MLAINKMSEIRRTIAQQVFSSVFMMLIVYSPDSSCGLRRRPSKIIIPRDNSNSINSRLPRQPAGNARHNPEAGLGDVAEVVPGAVEDIIGTDVQTHPRESIVQFGVEECVRGEERRARVPVHIAPGNVQVQVFPEPEIGLGDDLVADVFQGIEGPDIRFQLFVLRLVAVSQVEGAEEEVRVPQDFRISLRYDRYRSQFDLSICRGRPCQGKRPVGRR